MVLNESTRLMDRILKIDHAIDRRVRPFWIDYLIAYVGIA
jgi:hypothetical protein